MYITYLIIYYLILFLILDLKIDNVFALTILSSRLFNTEATLFFNRFLRRSILSLSINSLLEWPRVILLVVI